MRRILAGALLGLVAALAAATPAGAHGADAPDGTDYRTEVTEVPPELAGVTVRAVEGGGRLELANRSDRTVEVLGYDGEPYLEVRPDGVYENVHSPATYLNATLTGETTLPAEADPTLPPQWRPASTDPVVRWHDHRTHWMGSSPPPAVAADPDREHRIRDWVVPLRVGLDRYEVRGTLDWVPPPTAGLWWAAAALLAGAVTLLGLAPAGSRAAPAALGGLAVVGGLVAVGYAVARELDAGAVGVGGVLVGLLAGQVWPVLSGLGAVLAGGYALAGRAARDFALALAGGCLAVFAGVANVTVLARAIAPVPGPAVWARVAVVLVLGVGAGIALAAVLRLRAESRAALAAAAQD